MKRDLLLLLKEDERKVRQWIEGSPLVCPNLCGRCATCKKIFPRLPQRPSPMLDYPYVCPCSAFSVKYVTKIAKEIVNEKRT